MLNPTDYPEVNAALDEYLTALQGEFGDNLLAVYLLGSLSTGHYVPGWSDVNGVIVVRQADPAQVLHRRAQAVEQAVLKAQLQWQRLLFSCCVPFDALKNVTWQNQPECWGLVDLSNLVEDGLLIWGEELRDGLERPNLEELRAYLVWELAGVLEACSASGGFPLPLRVPRGDEWSYYHQHPTRVVDELIYPTRVLLTWDNGRVGSKSEAVDHYIEEYHGPWEPLLLQADALRRTGNLEALTPGLLSMFAGQAPGLFEWMLQRLLSILLLPDDVTCAAHNFRRWLKREPGLLPARSDKPYDNLAPGALGERTGRPGPEQPDAPPDIFIPSRKPWLRK